MSGYFLGVDIGSSKSHALITNEFGGAVGFGKAGAGNHETVGYEGLHKTLQLVVNRALDSAGLSKDQITAAGFGIAGYDWPSERLATLNAVHSLNLNIPLEVVNDTILGLLAGAPEGWGLALESGSGCNCRGWDRQHREGRSIGMGEMVAEAAGGGDIVARAIRAIALEWTRRGPATRLTKLFVDHFVTGDAAHLLERLSTGQVVMSTSLAPLVFKVAAEGDPVAIEIIRWAGRELGSLAIGVIRQIDLAAEEFDIVLFGSIYEGSPLLTETLSETVRAVAPGARFIRLNAPPVVGAVLLAMQQVNHDTRLIRPALVESAGQIIGQLNLA